MSFLKAKTIINLGEGLELKLKQQSGEWSFDFKSVMNKAFEEKGLEPFSAIADVLKTLGSATEFSSLKDVDLKDIKDLAPAFDRAFNVYLILDTYKPLQDKIFELLKQSTLVEFKTETTKNDAIIKTEVKEIPFEIDFFITKDLQKYYYSIALEIIKMHYLAFFSTLTMKLMAR